VTPRIGGIEGLVLDVDDTLYLERDYVASGFAAVDSWVEEQLGVSGFGARAWTLFLSGVRGRVFDRTLDALGMRHRDDLIRALVRCYREHEPQISLLPDAAGLIEGAVFAGLRVGVITDGPVESQQAKIRALGLGEWCDPIIMSAAFPGARPKPDSASFILLQEAWALDPAKLVYIGDNPAKDFRAPNDLGWSTVRVRRPGSLHEHLSSGRDVHEDVEDLSAWSVMVWESKGEPS
jgi:putative hydrolase of the HAD superfamily